MSAGCGIVGKGEQSSKAALYRAAFGGVQLKEVFGLWHFHSGMSVNGISIAVRYRDEIILTG